MEKECTDKSRWDMIVSGTKSTFVNKKDGEDRVKYKLRT